MQNSQHSGSQRFSPLGTALVSGNHDFKKIEGREAFSCSVCGLYLPENLSFMNDDVFDFSGFSIKVRACEQILVEKVHSS